TLARFRTTTILRPPGCYSLHFITRAIGTLQALGSSRLRICAERLRNLVNSGSLHNRGPALAFRKARSLILVGVHAPELLPIFIIYRYQIMMMFPAAIFFEVSLRSRLFWRCFHELFLS